MGTRQMIWHAYYPYQHPSGLEWDVRSGGNHKEANKGLSLKRILCLCQIVICSCIVLMCGCDRIRENLSVEKHASAANDVFWRDRAQRTYERVSFEKSDASRLQILNYVRLLRNLDTGGMVEERGKDGDTLLMAAVKNNDKDVVARLLTLDIMADVNTRNDAGEVPLIVAIRSNNMDLAECLMMHGAIVDVGDCQGLTPLMYAVKNKNADLVKAIINNGCDLRATDIAGKSAGDYAVDLKCDKIISLIAHAKTKISKETK